MIYKSLLQIFAATNVALLGIFAYVVAPDLRSPNQWAVAAGEKRDFLPPPILERSFLVDIRGTETLCRAGAASRHLTGQ
jgi:hypothetical protein